MPGFSGRPIRLRNAQQAREMARQEHETTLEPQVIAVRERKPVTRGLEYIVTALIGVERFLEKGWRIEHVVGTEKAPEALREPHIAEDQEDARHSALRFAAYWGTPFIVAKRDDHFLVIALVAWPGYGNAGWKQDGAIVAPPPIPPVSDPMADSARRWGRDAGTRQT